ncbi:hypothetical protein RRG08_019889 [Elysia crispata]|uniref:Uncharacterized protein n=1 Tax=Elysia crispata TaxID=231223 RepID=A0AAE1DBU2_9GAST|nr:hypothetical protein RRG08_019889 [Elysia crispata]
MIRTLNDKSVDQPSALLLRQDPSLVLYRHCTEQLAFSTRAGYDLKIGKPHIVLARHITHTKDDKTRAKTQAKLMWPVRGDLYPSWSTKLSSLPRAVKPTTSSSIDFVAGGKPLGADGLKEGRPKRSTAFQSKSGPLQRQQQKHKKRKQKPRRRRVRMVAEILPKLDRITRAGDKAQRVVGWDIRLPDGRKRRKEREKNMSWNGKSAVEMLAGAGLELRLMLCRRGPPGDRPRQCIGGSADRCLGMWVNRGLRPELP